MRKKTCAHFSVLAGPFKQTGSGGRQQFLIIKLLQKKRLYEKTFSKGIEKIFSQSGKIN